MKMMNIIQYKGFNIVKTGTREYPYNIYIDDGIGFGEHCGSGRTIKSCKECIDDGCYDEDVKRYNTLNNIMKGINK